MTFPSDYKNPDRNSNPIMRSNSKIFENPVIGLDLLEIPSYEINLIQGVEEYLDLDNMDLRPVEAGASIRFYSKRSSDDIVLPISKIKDLKIIKQSDGGFFRNEELTLEIKFETEYGDNIILINSSDKRISDFIPQVRSIQKRLYDELWWTNSNIYFRTEKCIYSCPNISYDSFPLFGRNNSMEQHTNQRCSQQKNKTTRSSYQL
jgi:hypothetical protein